MYNYLFPTLPHTSIKPQISPALHLISMKNIKHKEDKVLNGTLQL